MQSGLKPQCLAEPGGSLFEMSGLYKSLSEVCVSLRIRGTSDWSAGLTVLACTREIPL